MRFDKDLWNPACQEYHQGVVDAAAVNFITPAARVFIAHWLELLNDDRSPATCVLRHIALPDLLSELRRSCELWLDNDRRFHRFRAAVRLLARECRLLGFAFVGDKSIRRLSLEANELLALIEEQDPKVRNQLEKPIRLRLGLAPKDDLQKIAATRLYQAIVGCQAQIRGGTDFKDSLRQRIQDILADQNTTAEIFMSTCSHLVAELLALVLDRGNSRESLAELPVKYYRADNQNLAGTSFSDRTNLLFGAFHSGTEQYTVFLPIIGTQIDIQGEIFPPGLTLIDTQAWSQRKQDFANVLNFNGINDLSPAIRVDVGEYLASNLDTYESAPLDVFAARDVAVRASQLCLDAIFLYREHRVRLRTRLRR